MSQLSIMQMYHEILVDIPPYFHFAPSLAQQINSITTKFTFTFSSYPGRKREKKSISLLTGDPIRTKGCTGYVAENAKFQVIPIMRSVPGRQPGSKRKGVQVLSRGKCSRGSLSIRHCSTMFSWRKCRREGGTTGSTTL